MAFSGKFGAHEYLGVSLEIPIYRQTLPRLELELRRARRYERPLSMVVLAAAALQRKVQLNGRGGGAASIPLDTRPVLFAFLGGFLRSSLRETDLLTAVPESMLYVAFLPEVNGDGAEEAVARLEKGFAEIAAVDLRAGIAEFPRDGFTVADLFQKAMRASFHADTPRLSNPPMRQDIHG